MVAQLKPEFVPVGAEIDEKPKTTYEDDRLGHLLTRVFDGWKNARVPQDEEWLRFLRAFNKQNEENIEEGLHTHIYIGSTLTKCIAAYARISDPLFKSEAHWDISPTPVPETQFSPQEYESYLDEVTRRADNMKKEIEDLLIDSDYEHHLKAAIMECVILGSGCVKGATLGIKETESYQRFQTENGIEWHKIVSEKPIPQLSSPSVFNIYPDPDALLSGDVSGVFERHTINRAQLAALKADTRFDAKKIDKLLTNSQKGDHVDLWHESTRRAIANNKRVYATVNMFDLLEYWGQVSGYDLILSGFNHPDVEIKETDTYWCNIWICRTETLYNRVFPLKQRVNPYNIFHYFKVPHRFWGFGVAFLNEDTQLSINDTTWDLLDATAFSARPLAEVNVSMLKDGQDPSVISPAQIYLRDSGDPSTPAVRFFSPNSPIAALRQTVELMRQYADDGTLLPQFSYGDTSKEINQTMGGLSMQLGVAALPTKVVIKNIEDDCIKPVIKSVYDFVMKWSDNEDCKGDMNIEVKCSSVLLTKEARTQQLMQFSNVAASNPMTAKITDFKYLITEIAKSLDIDPDKAVPEQLPQELQPEQPQQDPITEAKAELLKAQAVKTQADAIKSQKEAVKTESEVKKVVAETAATNIKTQFGALQTAAQIVINPSIVPVGDSSLQSAGYIDANGAPVANVPEQQIPVANTGVQQNTSPQFPAYPPQPDQAALEPQSPDMVATQANGISPFVGMETMKNEVMQ